jgi:hypothetical protein
MLPSTALAGSVVALWADWPMIIEVGAIPRPRSGLCVHSASTPDRCVHPASTTGLNTVDVALIEIDSLQVGKESLFAFAKRPAYSLVTPMIGKK